MPEKWTGRLIGNMHNERVTYEELGNELGVSKAYVCMILNGQKKPKDGRAKLEGAFRAIVERRKAD